MGLAVVRRVPVEGHHVFSARAVGRMGWTRQVITVSVFDVAEESSVLVVVAVVGGVAVTVVYVVRAVPLRVRTPRRAVDVWKIDVLVMCGSGHKVLL